MKKLIALIISALLIICFAGCAGGDVSQNMWKPFFTGEEPEWKYNRDEPWAWVLDGPRSNYQEPGSDAHQSLSMYFKTSENYAGCFINSEGYLTVMLVNPTFEQAQEISDLSAMPVWIVAAEYTYDTLQKALNKAINEITDWISENPDSAVSLHLGYIDTYENSLSILVHGSGAPNLLSSMEFPEYVNIVYTPALDASQPHDIPRRPVIVWEKDSVIIKSARESYPVGTDTLLVTASHNVPNMRLYAPSSPLKVDKYVNGEWVDISGPYPTSGFYPEIFDIPAGEEKTVSLAIITPETLGVGLYRATYSGLVCLSSSGYTTLSDAIAGRGINDYVTIEFTVTEDAEPFPAS